jgi:hypothetical protein
VQSSRKYFWPESAKLISPPDALDTHNGVILLFPEKEAKSVCSRRYALNPKLGEADPGGLGACPQEKTVLLSSINR